MQTIVSAATLTAGLRATFSDAYKQSYDGVKNKLTKVMDLDLPSDKLTEIYAYFETAPYPRRWPRGDEISSKAFKSVQFSVTNFDWGRRVPWHENDREDDQTRTLYDQARQLGQHFGTLDERIFFQILLSQTNPDLLPSIPNAPDGAPLFSATAGDGTDRFGYNGGNVVTGTGLTAQQIQADFFNAIERFKLFRDTENQPLWDEGMLDGGGYMVIYNVENDHAIKEALKLAAIAQTFVNGTDLAAATIPNLVLENGYGVEFWPTQRITDDDIRIVAMGSPHKGVFKQQRRALRESMANVDTSDHSRNTKEEYIQWDSRSGYSVFLPYQTVLIDNA